jgi:hypothetical protein
VLLLRVGATLSLRNHRPTAEHGTATSTGRGRWKDCGWNVLLPVMLLPAVLPACGTCLVPLWKPATTDQIQSVLDTGW